MMGSHLRIKQIVQKFIPAGEADDELFTAEEIEDAI